MIHRCDDTTDRMTVKASPEPDVQVPSGLSYFEQEAADLCGTLSPRQLDVLKLLGNGLSHRHIGVALEISPHTAREYMALVYRKLAVNSAIEAAVIATKAGLL